MCEENENKMEWNGMEQNNNKQNKQVISELLLELRRNKKSRIPNQR